MNPDIRPVKYFYLREILKFFVGFQTAHVLVHIIFIFAAQDVFPIVFDFWLVKFSATETLHLIHTAYNIPILLVLIYFAHFYPRLRK